MSQQSDIDKRTRNVGLGLTGIVLTAIGFGIVRARRSGGSCKRVETSKYKGFSYYIEQCPHAEGVFYLAVIQVEVGQTLKGLDGAREWVRRMVDQKLTPATENTFV